MPIDYSKWNALGDSSDEEEAVRQPPEALPKPTPLSTAQKMRSEQERANAMLAEMTKGLALGTPSNSLDDAEARLAKCFRIVLLTGAGISTDSGLPDFRGPNGVWTKGGQAAKEASHIDNYRRSAEQRKASWLGQLEWDASGPNGRPPQPNMGHIACAELEQTGRLLCTVTQNIDALHEMAGSQKVITAHGSLSHVVCMRCGVRSPMSDALKRVAAGEADPPCLKCGGILKPDVVFFGEHLSEEKLLEAEAHVDRSDALVAIGSSLAVAPVNQLVPRAKRAGATLVIVNHGPTAFDCIADYKLSGSISHLLPCVFRSVIRQAETTKEKTGRDSRASDTGICVAEAAVDFRTRILARVAGVEVEMAMRMVPPP